jgi:hypothetical protein
VLIYSWPEGFKGMTGKEFINSVAKGKSDIIQTLLDILRIIEVYPELIGALPKTLKDELEMH